MFFRTIRSFIIRPPLFQAILAGDFILSAASMALARIGNITVVKVLSQVIEDLVRGKSRHDEPRTSMQKNWLEECIYI